MIQGQPELGQSNCLVKQKGFFHPKHESKQAQN
jgi:hypothetical protein